MRLSSVLLSAVAMGVAACGTAVAADDAVSRGKYLVYAGDCAACHTAPGGQAFAGGVILNTPFGSMATPNITPDQATGIGSWTDDQFYRLFHDGIGQHGEYIYPGFPYPWFTKVTRDDVMAIKAYLFTLPPVNAPKKPNHLMFPLNIRTSVAGWNLLFFKPGEFQPDTSKSAQWNRGAYLVEGLGHCSDCHTPKNIAMAPVNSRAYAGGVQDNWYAPNISSDSKDGVGGWTDSDLVQYLRTGLSRTHGVVLGPMSQTIHESLAHMTDGDLHAIVAYLKSTPPQTSYHDRTPVLASNERPGAELYQTYCASCHQQNGRGETGKIPALADNGAVTAKGPQNVIRVVLGGLRAQGSYGPMPGFGTVMTDQQIADVTNYVRSAWTNTAPANAGPGDVSAVAKETRSVMAGTQECPTPGTSPLDAAIADPASGIPDLLKGVNDEVLLQSANKIIAAVHAKAPGAPQADVVNELTDAYCPIVTADTSLDPAQRWDRLNRFGETVYTQLTTHGQQ
jgi:mono/diheme cytochrome c family protein